MNDIPYHQNTRIRTANILRRLFRYAMAEQILIFFFTKFRLAKKLVPPEYLYKPKSYRMAMRDGITYRFDLSNVIDHSLYFFNRYFTPMQLFRLIKSDTVIVDIGSNIGTAALHAAATAKNGMVYAYEPDSANYSSLRENMSLNHFENIVTIQKALGEIPTRSKLFKVNRFNNGMNRILPEGSPVQDFEIIEVSTLDEEMKRLKPIRIDLIKIDVEGYELNVLKGARQVLEQFHPLLVVEVVDVNLKNNGQSSAEVIEFLKLFGYKFMDLKNGNALTQSHYPMETDILCYTEHNPLA